MARTIAVSGTTFIVLTLLVVGLHSVLCNADSDKAQKKNCSGGTYDNWTNCATDNCEPKCQDRYPTCPKTPCFGACRCDKGYYRRSDGCCAGPRMCVRASGICQ